MRIIGVDPGLRRAGWGVIDAAGGRLRFVASGLCEGGDGPMAVRLSRLHGGLRDAVAGHAPDVAAIETTFVNADAGGALKLGQARGVALLALAQAGLEIAEFAPLSIKKAVVGVARADKAQVATMVAHLLPGARADAHDAWDALAVAICRAHRAPAVA